MYEQTQNFLYQIFQVTPNILQEHLYQQKPNIGKHDYK